MAEDTCGTCAANRGERPAPGGVIHQDDLWRLEHAFSPIPTAGWLVLKPLRHVESIADLTEAEALSLGPLLQRTARALRSTRSPSKVYVAQFSEARGYTHIHFHLIPRADGIAEDERGPWIFRRLARAAETGQDQAPLAEAERISVAVRTALGEHRVHLE